MAELRVDGVCKVYPGGVQAVDGVSLAVGAFELVTLVGPSGSGKTTLLRLVAGLETVTAGTIRMGGTDVTDWPPRDRDVAMVFQNGALYPQMTVYENMASGLRLRAEAGWFAGVRRLLACRGAWHAARQRRRRIREKVESAAEVLGIRHLLKRHPRQLSGGERQRVALGRALVRDPQVFLFDEPLSSLDAKLRLEMRAELRRLHRRLQATTLYVTHDQEEAIALGDRVAVMKDGRIQQCDLPDRVLDRPANRFVAGFVGMPPMNFMPGRLTGQPGRVFFEDGPVRLALAPATAAGVSGFVERDVVLGFRPEALSDRAAGASAGHGDAPDADQAIDVTVAAVERVGEKVHLHARTARGRRLVCRLDADRGRRLREGQSLPLYVKMARVHLFEPGEAGRNLIPDGCGAAASG